MFRDSSRPARYLLPLLGLLLLPLQAQGAEPTVTALREACSGVFPAIETPEDLSCVRYINDVRNVGIVGGTLCETTRGSMDAAVVGLWLHLGQFPGHELAEPHVLDFLKDYADCSLATSASRPH